MTERIYLDAAPVIYAVEQVVPFARLVDTRSAVAAVIAGCSVFLTNDHRLDRFAETAVEVIRP